MERNQRSSRRAAMVTGVVAVAVVLAMMPAVPAQGQDSGSGQRKPRVLPHISNVYGNTYGEWSARWWQWLMSIPEATNPNLDTTGANCAEGQAGPVWFLAGTFGGPVTRSCTVPAGKALFFSPLNQLNGAGVFDCEPTAPGLCNLNVLRGLAAESMDRPRKIEVTVDGIALQPKYRVQSPVMTLTFPEGAVFELPSGTFTPNVSDGYWVMLAPLSRGAHTIHLKAVSNSGFEVEVTYNLTVGP